MTEITCFGCRGSHAVSGKEFALFGGHTTSFLVTNSESDIAFLIDAGSGICNLTLPPEIRKAVLLFTHTHLDHIAGFPFLPALKRKDFELTVAGPVAAHGAGIKDVVSTLFAPAFFPVNWNDFPATVTFKNLVDGECRLFSDTVVDCFRLPHSSATLGYRLQIGQRTAVFCFDAELEALKPQQAKEIGSLVARADFFAVDATYTAQQYADGRVGFGHSSAETAAAFADAYDIKKTGLTHHSPEATDSELLKREVALQKRFPSAGIFFLKEGMKIVLD